LEFFIQINFLKRITAASPALGAGRHSAAGIKSIYYF